MTRERVGDAPVVVGESLRGGEREGSERPLPASTDRRRNPDRRNAAERPDVDSALVNELVAADLGRSDAVRLASLRPEECRRQITFLPFVTEFKTSRGAYLRRAIERGFGPPPGFEEAQKQQQEAQRRERAAAAAQSQGQERERREAQEKETVERVLSDPAARAQITEEALRRMPPPLRGKPEHVAYKSALNGLVRRIALERQTKETQDANGTV